MRSTSGTFLSVLALAFPLAVLAQPSITNVQNNYSYLVAGQPNYGIAPSTIFIVVGTGMANTTTVSSLQNSNTGLPTSLNGASVSVTVNGVTTHPAFYYAIATQLALVLPAATPVGTGTITVTFNGQNGSAPINVVQSALGFDTLYGSGTGLAVATNNATGAVFNYTTSAAPGQTIVLWSSGLGADTADSDTTFTSSPHAVSVPLTVYVGGIQAAVVYAGSSGYPGLNQVNVTIPAGVSPGCGVSVVAVGASNVSNTVTIPVNPGGGVCADPVLGATGTQILNLGGKTTFNSGSVELLQSTVASTVRDVATGDFASQQGSQAASGVGYVSLGNCVVTPQTSGDSTFTPTQLDAGTLSVTGPLGTQTLKDNSGQYALTLPAGFVPAAGGTFTFNATGGTTPGASVGAFSASLNFTAPLVWSNMSSIAAVNRAQGQTISWAGGSSDAFVIIEGGSTDSSSQVSVGFTCFAAASAGQFTIPGYILDGMPAGIGSLEVGAETGRGSFSASGLDQGTVAGFSGAAISSVPYN